MGDKCTRHTSLVPDQTEQKLNESSSSIVDLTDAEKFWGKSGVEAEMMRCATDLHKRVLAFVAGARAKRKRPGGFKWGLPAYIGG